jgi:hypothetical protein
MDINQYGWVFEANTFFIFLIYIEAIMSRNILTGKSLPSNWVGRTALWRRMKAMGF